MWVIYAFGSAFFAGITAILAKMGIKNINSSLVTALRTVVVVIFSWIMVLLAGSAGTIAAISSESMIFLMLSGCATGASWLFYFQALKSGDVNKVVPIDKSNTILTMLLAFLFLGEKITVWILLGMALLGIGTFLMIQRVQPKSAEGQKVPESFDSSTCTVKSSFEKTARNHSWLVYAVLSAVFASLTAILGKIGIEHVESNLGTALRTLVVLAMAWLVVFLTGSHSDIKKVDRKCGLFILFSGVATGLSWLCYYRALQEGPASVVAPIDKMSIAVTVLFAYVFLHEKLSKRAFAGLLLFICGTMLLLIKV